MFDAETLGPVLAGSTSPSLPASGGSAVPISEPLRRLGM